MVMLVVFIISNVANSIITSPCSTSLFPFLKKKLHLWFQTYSVVIPQKCPIKLLFLESLLRNSSKQTVERARLFNTNTWVILSIKFEFPDCI